MDLLSVKDIKRLEDQVLQYKPNITSAEKKYLSVRLRNQLLHSRAMVKIYRIDEECDSLLLSIKQRVMLLQEEFLLPRKNDLSSVKKSKVSKDQGDFQLNLSSSDSSEDESLASLTSKQNKKKTSTQISQKNKIITTEMQQADTSEVNLPLAWGREPRERKLSFKSYNSSSSSHSKKIRKQIHKQEHTVSTSGVTFNSEEILVEQEELDTTPTLHIKIPSLQRGNVHYIILDSLNFGRKVFDYRANNFKQQQQKKTISINPKTKPRKKSLSCPRASVSQNLTQLQELELSQLIQNVMAEACHDETLQATSALESINNNLIDNYELIGNEAFTNYSQSSQEFSFPRNSKEIAQVGKKVRKYTKRSNEHQHSEPPKKRGRKSKSNTAQLHPKAPTKSNLAQYVELFSNDCGLEPGSSTPTASSTKSQPLVSSTTHNFDVVEQLPKQREQQTSSQEPITYYIDGDWVNGGPCKLVSTNAVLFEGTQTTPCNNVNAPFQDYVNCTGSGNNVISTVLGCNNSLPVAIPRSITNLTAQNKNQHQIHNQSTYQNSLLPIINIQIPQLPNDINTTVPLPAHTHKDVIDLSVKAKTNVVAAEPFRNLQSSCLTEDEECMPLDLTTGSTYNNEKLSENNFVTIDTQDEEFIRHLIEQNDFNYRTEDLTKGDENEISVYELADNKSLKASLDMPLLDFDATALVQFVENPATTSIPQQNILTEKNTCSDSKSNEDSNYVSMSDVNSSVENILNFTDQSTTEIFNKLLNISPDNNFLSDVCNDEYATNDVLNESVFDKCRVENSTMYEYRTTEGNQLEKRNKKICNSNSNSEKANQEIENTSNDQSSCSRSLTVQLDSSNTTMNIASSKLSQIEINLKSPLIVKANVEQSLLKEEKQTAIGVENSKTTSISNKSLGKPKVKENVIGSTIPKKDVDENNKSVSYSSKVGNKNAKNIQKTQTSINTNDNNRSASNDAQLPEEENDYAEHLLDFSHVKNGNNIVFSMAKIPLSDDYTLYATDSDVSSGKSCDLNELKSVNHVSRPSFTDCNKRDNVLNLHNKEEEKLKDTEKTIEEKIPDICNNVEGAEVEVESGETKDMLNTKSSNPNNENLTLLELDSKLESFLDFDEDFDDALSLATSCFDSPNDERFEDSVADIDTKATTHILNDLQQYETHCNTSQIKELKYFKIPKLKISTESNSKMVAITPETTKISNFMSKVSLTKTVVLPQNVEKITRTVKNDLADLNADSADMIVPSGKYLANERTTLENIIYKIFGITCLPHLIDECCDLTHCQSSHQLNGAEIVYKNLNTLDKIQANLAYKFLYNHSKLFKIYFKNFCIYYTNKNDRTKLLNMANDCERYPEYAEFIIAIYEGLVKCGLSRANACRLILKRVRESTVATSIVEALVAIIMKSDWTMFADFIEKYTQAIYQFKFGICLLEQMAPAALNSKTTHLKQIFAKCVETLDEEDKKLLVKSPILIQCSIEALRKEKFAEL